MNFSNLLNPLRRKLIRPLYFLPFFNRLGITWMSKDEWLATSMGINPKLYPLLTEEQKKRIEKFFESEK